MGYTIRHKVTSDMVGMRVVAITWTSVLLVLGGDGEGRIVGLDEL